MPRASLVVVVVLLSELVLLKGHRPQISDWSFQVDQPGCSHDFWGGFGGSEKIHV